MSCDLLGEHAVHAVSSLGSVGLLDVKKKPLADWDPLLKRLEDYGLGALMLIASAVLFPLIALAIKLDSPGPVFFRQRRRGFNQGVFKVLKFRTMRVLEDGAAEMALIIAASPQCALRPRATTQKVCARILTSSQSDHVRT
jgi:lipopolysaccharide/colanic/teichoic acid biosynthesis glycosyltransferase